MKAEKPKTWKSHLLEGFLFVLFAGGAYWYFTDFENAHDGSRSIHWLLAILYNFGGKWLVIGILLLIAVAEFGTAWKKRLNP